MPWLNPQPRSTSSLLLPLPPPSVPRAKSSPHFPWRVLSALYFRPSSFHFPPPFIHSSVYPSIMFYSILGKWVSYPSLSAPMATWHELLEDAHSHNSRFNPLFWFPGLCYALLITILEKNVIVVVVFVVVDFPKPT